MTIKYLDSKRLSGVASDTKPTNVQDNSIYIETDTAYRYWFNGTAWFPTFQDNFTTDGWTDSGTPIAVNVSTNVIDWDAVRDSTHKATQIDLGTGISEDSWVLRFKIRIDARTNTSSGSNYLWVGLRDQASVATDSEANQDFLGMELGGSTSSAGGYIRGRNSNGVAIINGTGGTDTTLDPESGDIWYVEFRRTSSTTSMLRVFSDSTYRTQIGIDSPNTNITSSYTGMRYLVVLKRNSSAGGGTFNGTIDDVEFFNGVTSI